MSGVSLAPCIDLISRAAAASGEADQAVFFQQVGQVSRRCRLGDLCDRLVLRSADAVFEALLTTVEQAIEDLDLFSRQREVAVLLPEPTLFQHSVNPRHGLLHAA